MSDAAAGRRSDLKVRLMSAIVMISVALAAFLLWGAVWTTFVTFVAMGLFFEGWGLASRIFQPGVKRMSAMAALAFYFAAGATGLLIAPRAAVALAVVCVIATDSGAYFAGRTFGGPKIAPSISPSKTWSGLAGGMAAAAIVVLTFQLFILSALSRLDTGQAAGWGGPAALLPSLVAIIAGMLIAILAQAGDFFESWLKRKAGVKDSGKLIPGHGGLFDRVDGLLPVAILVAVLAKGVIA